MFPRGIGRGGSRARARAREKAKAKMKKSERGHTMMAASGRSMEKR